MMKRIMSEKKLYVMLLLAMVAVFMSGCGKKPEDTVDKFCSSMQGLDFEKMAECVADADDMDDMTLDTEDETTNIIMDYLKSESEEIKYKIRKVDKGSDEATVAVSFKYNDQSDVLKTAMGNYFQQGIAQAFSGTEVNYEELFNDCLKDAIDSSKKKRTEKNIELNLELIDKEWKIVDLDEEVADVMLGNAVSVFSDMANAFDSNDSSSNDSSKSENNNKNSKREDFSTTAEVTELDEENYIDVPAGEELELATLKIRINGYRELDELKDDYSSVQAKDGTKYVQIDVTVENITKDPMSCDLNATAVDSKGRSFNESDDSIFYTSDHILYRELAPNIPETGTISFNVPVDAKGFYMPIAHAGTNQVYHLLFN